MPIDNKTDTAVIFASSLGRHVRKTADYIAKKLHADRFDLKQQSNIDLTSYDRIIVGTGIHAGRPYSKVTAFINDKKADLSSKKTVLFICCKFKGERGADQCQNIASQLGVSDASFFPDSGEKDENGINKDVVAFVERMS